MVKVKICGITNLEDALSAVSFGADALGFNFVEGTPRYIDPDEVYEIIRELPPLVIRVGVFRNDFLGRIRQISNFCRLDMLQFHGDETPEYLRQFSNLRVIKAIRVKNEKSLEKMKDYDQDTFLIDTFDSDIPGGTGRLIDISLASIAIKSNNRIILSGGLTPDNIIDVLKKVQPYAVDVCSGVESTTKGKKDYSKLKIFIDNVRKVEL